jgi:hypothetical protein
VQVSGTLRARTAWLWEWREPCGRTSQRVSTALRRPFEQRITSPVTVARDLQKRGLHSGKPMIADKDEVGGSSPPRPTIRPLTSGNAARPLGHCRLPMVQQESTGVGPSTSLHSALASTLPANKAHFPDASACCTAVVERITSRANVDAARRAASKPEPRDAWVGAANVMSPNWPRSGQPHPLPRRGRAATADARDHRLSRPSR